MFALLVSCNQELIDTIPLEIYEAARWRALSLISVAAVPGGTKAPCSWQSLADPRGPFLAERSPATTCRIFLKRPMRSSLKSQGIRAFEFDFL